MDTHSRIQNDSPYLAAKEQDLTYLAAKNRDPVCQWELRAMATMIIQGRPGGSRGTPSKEIDIN